MDNSKQNLNLFRYYKDTFIFRQPLERDIFTKVIKTDGVKYKYYRFFIQEKDVYKLNDMFNVYINDTFDMVDKLHIGYYNKDLLKVAVFSIGYDNGYVIYLFNEVNPSLTCIHETNDYILKMLNIKDKMQKFDVSNIGVLDLFKNSSFPIKDKEFNFEKFNILPYETMLNRMMAIMYNKNIDKK